MTVGITDDDDYYAYTYTHTHRARAYFCISRSFPLGFLRLYDGDRIGLRILLLSSLDRSDFRDLARVEVAEAFDELEIAHHDELLDDVGTIHPFLCSHRLVQDALADKGGRLQKKKTRG